MSNQATDNTQAAPTQATPTQKASASDKRRVTVLVGSLRGGSFARKIAKQAIELLPEDCTGTIVEIGHLPLYNFDYDDPEVTDVQTPDSYTEFRETIKASDGILFVTSEKRHRHRLQTKLRCRLETPPGWHHQPFRRTHGRLQLAEEPAPGTLLLRHAHPRPA